MAKSNAPGTSVNRGVSTTMGNAMKVSVGQPSNSMGAPFDKPLDTGGGGIPVVIYDKNMPSVSVPKPSQDGPLGAQGGQKRPGTK